MTTFVIQPAFITVTTAITTLLCQVLEVYADTAGTILGLARSEELCDQGHNLERKHVIASGQHLL